jgi:hypothetical protein
VYLPISSSSPIFVGGLIRWLVDHRRRQDLSEHRLSEEQLVAESDKSPGVLLASGYIAGGAIAGILLAILAGKFEGLDSSLAHWAEANNPFYGGPSANALALLPFAALTILLYLVGREAFGRSGRQFGIERGRA